MIDKNKYVPSGILIIALEGCKFSLSRNANLLWLYENVHDTTTNTLWNALDNTIIDKVKELARCIVSLQDPCGTIIKETTSKETEGDPVTVNNVTIRNNFNKIVTEMFITFGFKAHVTGTPLKKDPGLVTAGSSPDYFIYHSKNESFVCIGEDKDNMTSVCKCIYI